MRTALDSNILSSLWSNEPSALQVENELQRARTKGGIVICGPVYIELLAYPLVQKGFVDRFLNETAIAVEFVLDEAVWRRAAEGFVAYAKRRRRSGGKVPRRLLADFVIAAHALLSADRLFTLDPSRYQQDFPELQLI